MAAPEILPRLSNCISTNFPKRLARKHSKLCHLINIEYIYLDFEKICDPQKNQKVAKLTWSYYFLQSSHFRKLRELDWTAKKNSPITKF